VNELVIPEYLKDEAKRLAIPTETAEGILAAYAPHAVEFSKLEREAAGITDAMPTAAREVRLALMRVRTGSDKTRKLLKAESLVRGRAIDGLHALVEMKVGPLEQRMLAIEKAEERAAAARLAALVADRMAKIAGLVESADPYAASVGSMTETQFADFLAALTTMRDQRLAVEAKAAAEAKAKAEAEAAERKRADEERRAQAARLAELEAERIAAMAREAEAKRIADEKEAAARKAIADEIAKRQAVELAAKQEADRQAAAARKAIADQIHQREEAQRRADAIEAAARQAELERVRQEAARKRVEQEKAAELEAERKRAEELARQQPDATKLRLFAAQLLAMETPALTSDYGKEAARKIIVEITKLSDRILATADKLEGKEQGGAK
jgi:hypothetical protein